MAKSPIGDQLVQAMAAIDELQKTVAKHDRLLTRLVDRFAQIDERLLALEGADKR